MTRGISMNPIVSSTCQTLQTFHKAIDKAANILESAVSWKEIGVERILLQVANQPL